MTNKDKYKQAFSTLHFSKNFSFDLEKMEVEKMNKLNKKRTLQTVVAAFAMCFVVLGGSVTAYATNLGGIQQTIQQWVKGELTEVEILYQPDGSYEMSVTDENGVATNTQSGSGVAFDENGNERPLTVDEVIKHLSLPEVEYTEDGKVYLYYTDQVIDITDKFEDGICYVKINTEDKPLYITVLYGDGFLMSEDKYIIQE